MADCDGLVQNRILNHPITTAMLPPMINRDLTPRLKKLASQFPSVTLTGPRQSGKSTLCRAIFPKHAYANLEAPDIHHLYLPHGRSCCAQHPLHLHPAPMCPIPPGGQRCV